MILYIIKNAFRCIGRSRGRNILIGIIVLAIALSACLGLSIRQAAENAKKETLEGMSVTATISFDRQSMMGNMLNEGENDEPPSFDRDAFSQMMGEASGLTLEEYKAYAEAPSVSGFYYTMSASLNGSDAFLPVTSDTPEEGSAADAPNGFSQGFGGKGGGRGQMMMGAQSDFSVEGVSSEEAMTAFMQGTASITRGENFDPLSDELNCIISEELATFNGLSVGDTVVLTNPNNEEELFTLAVVGIYNDTSANSDSFSMMGATSTDPANKIYMAYPALNGIIEVTAQNAATLTDENTGREYTTDIKSTLSATYSFKDLDSYYSFEEEVRELGLDDSYTVSSSDLESFEARMVPLNTLSQMAGYFLIVILIIGAIILIVLNIFNVRERKYEIGVLTAMGMKKGKVAAQFLTEIFAVTLAAVLLGAIIGGTVSVPVTNALLEGQVAQQTNRSDRIEESFGRGPGSGSITAPEGNAIPDDTGRERPQGGFKNLGAAAVDYITEIDSAMNITVVLQMLGIALLLTLISGAASMLFVMRYDPLKILANRD